MFYSASYGQTNFMPSWVSGLSEKTSLLGSSVNRGDVSPLRGVRFLLISKI